MIPKEDNKKLLVILLFVLLQWVICLEIGFDNETGIWSFPNPDTMCTLNIARSWVHGHPMQIIPGEPPSTMLADLISPLLIAPGYYFGFKSLSAFVIWAYIEFLFVALFSAFFVWRFSKKYMPEIAFGAALLSVTFNGIFSNFFSTNFGFFFMFFWGALAYLNSFPLFMTFGICAGLLRPEGAVFYLFLGYIYYVSNDRKIPKKFFLGLLPVIVPFIIYLNLTGSLIPQGILPQNILHYSSPLEGIETAFSTIIDQIKGGLLGLYLPESRIGSDNTGWLGSLPLFLFPLALFGIWKEKKEWLLPIILLLLFLIAGDSFTIYSGTHQNRHIQVLTPFFFCFSLQFIYGFSNSGINRKVIYGSGIAFFFMITQLQFYSSLHGKKSNVEKISHSKQIIDYINEKWPESHVLVQDMSTIYWIDGRQKVHILYPSVDPYLGRYVKYYNRILEISEYIQRFFPTNVLFIKFSQNSLLTSWLSSFEENNMKSFMIGYKKYGEIKSLNLNELRDKAPYGEPYSELDIGDALSEHENSYSYTQDLEEPVGSFLIKGKDFRDGGRPYVTSENFQLPVPGGGGILVCRYKGEFPGNILDPKDVSTVNLTIRESRIKIYSNDKLLFNQKVNFDKDFSYLTIPLDEEGINKIKINGLIHSFHYWIYRKNDLKRIACFTSN